MKVNGKRMNEKDKELRDGQMELVIKVALIEVKNMAMEHLC
jgi:hypothetical protein